MNATQASATKPSKTHAAAPAAAMPAPPPTDTPGSEAPAGEDRESCIRRTAYAYFEARGGVHGHELEDWLRAEAEFEAMATDEPAPQAH